VTPPQVRGVVRLSLAKPTRVKDINITFTGITRTDWPEGLKQHGMDVIEQVEITRLGTSIFRTSEGTPVSLGHSTEARHGEVRNQSRRGSQTPMYMRPDDVWERSRERERSSMPTRAPPNTRLSMRGIIEGLRSPKTSPTQEAAPILEPLNAASQTSFVPAEWFELGKGEYEYPFSISLPFDLPPTLHAEFGHVTYMLKATVFRSGTLTSNLSSQREVTLVQIPHQEPSPLTDSIFVDRVCDDMLSYSVEIEGNSFPVTTKIPVHLTMIPIGKTRVHRISFTLEEKTEYYAKERRISRPEKPLKWNLVRLQNESVNDPLLPLTHEDPRALETSPLLPYIEAAAQRRIFEEEETRLAPLNPLGPWHLKLDLPVTMGRQKVINISCQHPKSNVAVHHNLTITIRVEKIPVNELAPLKSRILDIVIIIPIKITHSKTSFEWISLPSYESSQQAPSFGISSLQDPNIPESPPPPPPLPLPLPQ